jgi:hypothetical protein
LIFKTCDVSKITVCDGCNATATIAPSYFHADPIAAEVGSHHPMSLEYYLLVPLPLLSFLFSGDIMPVKQTI